MVHFTVHKYYSNELWIYLTNTTLNLHFHAITEYGPVSEKV